MDQKHTDFLFPKKDHSQWFLIVGLFILIISIASSVYAIKNLEKAISARRQTFEVKDKYSDIESILRKWTLTGFQCQNTPSPDCLDSQERRDIQADLDSLFNHITDINLLDDSPSKKDLIALSKLQWQKLKSENTPTDTIAVEKIITTVRAIDQLDEKQLAEHQKKIFFYTNLITTAISGSVIIALAIILFSLINKNRNDKNRLLTIKELDELHKQALSASQLKTKFLSTVSHEIRTPLNGIIGLTDILINNPSKAEYMDILQTIKSSGESLLRIINDILDFSKIESGKLDLEVSEFSIIEVLDQVIYTLLGKATEKGLSLNYTITPDTPTKFRGDAGRLSQVLFNLVGNAIKFTDIGSVIIRVETVSINEKLTTLQFCVEDTGRGLTEDELNHLFVPFVQGRRTGTAGEVGTGLGLSISQQIVELLGGRIRVESKLNFGSRFMFQISVPMVGDERVGKNIHTKMRKLPPVISAANPIFLPIDPPKILVAEDNPTNQIVAKTMLSQLGAEVTIVANGEECVEAVKTNSFDLICMDCQMPVLDGYEATREIRKLSIDTTIIAMTANASSNDIQMCLDSGMNGVITKPFDFNRLIGMLHTHIRYHILLDTNVLLELKNKIGQDATNRIIDSFLTSITETKESLAKPETLQNTNTIHQLGHKLKSSCKTVGAFYLAEQFVKLEHSNGEDITKYQSKILKSIESTKLSLIEWKNTPPP